MQTLPHTPAHAQHVPDGWSFPALSPAVPPPATSPAVMGGGGAAESSATRVRWGRILLLLATVALVAFGAWRATSDGAPAAARTVAGSGTKQVEVAPAGGADEGSEDLGTSGAGGSATTDSAAGVGRSTTTPITPRATPRAGARPRPAAGAGARRPARRAAAGAAAGSGFATAPAMAAPATATGGGGAPAGQLPVTGLETWIAAALGILVLGLGIALQVHAVRIGMTAMLYRRGILLRPVDCARLAQEHGLSQLRVLLSNALHRLLQEPAGGSDFVRVRAAR